MLKDKRKKYVDALATLSDKINLIKKIDQVTILWKIKPIILIKRLEQEASIDKTDWHTTITKALSDLKESLHLKQAKHYYVILEVLYKRMSEGILIKCVHEQEGEKLIYKIHEVWCAIKSNFSLYIKIQRASYYWPYIKRQTQATQLSYIDCQNLNLSRTSPRNHHAWRLKKLCIDYL